MNKIEIYGKEYPCRLTMGALMRFKQRTGKELSDLGTDLTLLASLARCCVESACAADGVAAPEEDEQRFADALTMDKVSEFALMVAGGDDGAKKKPEAQGPSA